MANAKKLTAPQVAELKKLARGRQSTYGCSRARVQNSLNAKGLARFCDADGKRRVLSVAEIIGSYGNPHGYCEITPAGRQALLEARGGDAIEAFRQNEITAGEMIDAVNERVRHSPGCDRSICATGFPCEARRRG